MRRNNTIGIVGRIAAPPVLVVDAAEWEKRVYETVLVRKRPSGTEDRHILRFSGGAAGTPENLSEIAEGIDVLAGGEIRTEDLHDPKPEESRTKIYIYAEVIRKNVPPVKDQNEVGLCGTVCKEAHIKTVRRRTRDGKRLTCAYIIVAVNTQSGTYYIPCVCWNWAAFSAKLLKVGDKVEIFGRFQSREYKKRIEGREIPFLCTTHEVSVISLKSGEYREVKRGGRK